MTTMYDIERRLMALETRLGSINSREARNTTATDKILVGYIDAAVSRYGEADVVIAYRDGMVIRARDYGFIDPAETIPRYTNCMIGYSSQSSSAAGTWWFMLFDCSDSGTTPPAAGGVIFLPDDSINAALLLMEERRRRRVVVRRRIEDDWYQTNNRLLEGGGPDDPGGPA